MKPERQARALARKDYFSGKVSIINYPTVDRYEDEWWEERYLPIIIKISGGID